MHAYSGMYIYIYMHAYSGIYIYIYVYINLFIYWTSGKDCSDIREYNNHEIIMITYKYQKTINNQLPIINKT